MSYSEVNHREGMAYGGMPHAALLAKLEETDPRLFGRDEFHDRESDYHDYMRSEIVDWSPDTAYLESDHTRRDPGLSRSMINLRYNGTRGSDHRMPTNPDLFVGFTGNDPRGSNTDPRMDLVREQMTARASRLEVSMGKNDDQHIAESPWTDASISEMRQEVHRRLKAGHMRVFSAQRENTAGHSGVAVDPYAARDLRAEVMSRGDEALGREGRFHGGDHGDGADRLTDGVRGVDAGRRAGAELQPWRHTTGDADLGVQKYGQTRGAGATRIGATGGARLRDAAADQDWAESARGQGTNRAVVAAPMAVAARQRALLKSGQHEQDYARTYEAFAAGAGLTPGADVVRAYRYAVEDQTRRAGEVQDGDGGRLGGAAGLTPGTRVASVARLGEGHTTPNGYISNVAAIVSGLREGTAAGRRRVAGMVVADGARPDAVTERFEGPRRSAAPMVDNARVAALTEMPLLRAAAAEGLVVHSYKGAVPVADDQVVARGRLGFDNLTWRAQHEAAAIGKSGKADAWRSATQGQTTIGDAASKTFGFDAEVGAGGAAPMGPKRLRAGAWSESVEMQDSVPLEF